MHTKKEVSAVSGGPALCGTFIERVMPACHCLQKCCHADGQSSSAQALVCITYFCLSDECLHTCLHIQQRIVNFAYCAVSGHLFAAFASQLQLGGMAAGQADSEGDLG